MEELTVATIDFGSQKFSMSIGKTKEDDIDVIRSCSIGSEGIHKGIIVDEDKCCQSLKNLIVKVKETEGYNLSDVYVGISSRNTRVCELNSSVNLREGKVRGTDIKRAIEKGKRNVILSESEEVIDIIINFFDIDGNIVCENVTGYTANILGVNLTIIIGDSNELDKYRRVLSKCELHPIEFIPNIVSSRKVFLNDKNSLGIKALVDIGAGMSDIAIFNNGVLKELSSVSLGGSNITRDLAICGDFSLSEAEVLKRTYSSTYESLYNNDEKECGVGSVNISTKLLYEVTKARLEEIVEYVNLELKKTSFFEGICSIIIYGDGISCYEDVSSVIKEQIKKKTKVIKSENLGMQDFANISSLSLIKDVYDRLKLVYDNSINLEVDEYELNVEKDNPGILGRFKNFLEEIF